MNCLSKCEHNLCHFKPLGECTLAAFYMPKSRRGSLRLFCVQNKEVIDMTLNILFLTVTIKKRNVSAAEYERAEMAKKQYEATRDRMLSIQRLF